MRNPKILVFAGSNRSGSFNVRLADMVMKELVQADAEVTRISLADYPLPLYDADLEAAKGVPEHAVALKRLFQAHSGVFIAAPEYNASVTPLLKNALDWISRVAERGEARNAAFKNRVFAVGSASPGQFGGMRGLMTLRTVLEVGLGALVLPEQVCVPHAGDAFAEDGSFREERVATALRTLARRLVREASTYADELLG
ncbi:NAD(P)H-dependent oxidoreductase [Breoghania sp. L-A4]|uniref:NADPH-dependent FMN reductase n=1 Tax=Breoghania sp. L-A4 TaxID=2304600 RepID=UPI000E35DA78|nr:NAD(P)H-dependent oxidoreductase [Breoghania sp. L-A4]AXS38992.1 NADPH-dependent oxidoreductase [Breoghania sp. L-A4]